VTDIFLRACFGKPVERTPVWIMRQAGRYLPEYREIRAQHDFWTVCRTPELAARVTLQPVERLGVDAAILFSDILVSLPAMGLPVAFRPGPSIAQPVRTRSQVEALRVPSPPDDLSFVLDAIRLLRKELAGRVPLIGFGGAPLTLAAYMVDGAGGKGFPALRTLLYDDPATARRLLDHLVEAQGLFLEAQIEAGAQAVQIFDTWAGLLSPDLYKTFALEPAARLVERLRRPGVPVIYYLRDAAHLLEAVGRCGADVISVEEKIPLSRAARLIGPGPALQGNLDSAALLASHDVIERLVSEVLDDVPKDRGHVFNLGHGILPQTPVESASFLVETVRRRSRRPDPAGDVATRASRGPSNG